MSTESNALIGEAAAIVLDSPSLAEHDWESISLVVSCTDARKGENGFLYAGHSFEGWSTGGPDLIMKMLQLRQQMVDDGDRQWQQALIQITRADQSLTMQFEYDEPARWSPVDRKLDMSDYAESLRP